MRRLRSSRGRGFSLVELMAATAIGGVLLSLAVPSFHDVILISRRSAVLNQLLASMQLARSESMKRGGHVTICPSTDGATCSLLTTDWRRGWIVYANLDRDSSGAEPDAGEPILQYAEAEAAVSVSSGARRSFSFRPFQINSDNGTITVCDERAAASPGARRAIIVNTVGRPRISDRKADGGALDCA